MKSRIGIIAGVLAVVGAAYVGTKLFAQTGTPAGARSSTPQTRVAVINLRWVVKHYVKYTNFIESMKLEDQKYNKQLTEIRVQAEALAKKIQGAGGVAVEASEKEKAENELRKLERDRQEIVEKARRETAKKVNDEMVKVYKEIRDAAWRHAQAYNYDMVIHFGGPVDKDEVDSPALVLQNFQASGCVPLYWNPSLDISAHVLSALNANMPKPAAPAAAPK